MCLFSLQLALKYYFIQYMFMNVFSNSFKIQRNRVNQFLKFRIITLIQYQFMNTQERSIALNKFIDYLDTTSIRSSHFVKDDVSEIDINQDNLPKLAVVGQLMNYHKDITGTIEQTYREVNDIMIHMKELKNRKKNVQTMLDCMTSIVEVKKLSYGLGTEPRQIYNNLQTYYSIRNKVYYMDKFVDRIEKQIIELQKQYQNIFDAEMTKNNSNNIAEISKVLQLIRKHTHKMSTPDTLHQITEYFLDNAKKQFKKIEEELFAVPIVGSSESNYLFFDMAKTAMKIIATLSSNCKNNVVKVSGQQGFIQILKSLFQLVTNGIILELLMRLKKYYEVDKIVLNQSKFALRERQFKQLQPYFKEFVAIWNQLERLKIHLLAQINETCTKKNELKLFFETILNNTSFVQINANVILFMQAMMRYKFDKLLKTSQLVIAVCGLDSEFFKDINSKNIVHNIHVQDFLEETMVRISEGIEKALQTLNTLIISAIINFANHNLIFEDVFYAFNELFTRSFNKLPSNDIKVQNAVLLTLNALTAFPRALKTLNHITLPEEIPEARIRAQIQQVVNNNEQRANKVLQGLLNKIVSAQWFRFDLNKDYEKILDKWMGLQVECFNNFVQCVCKVHAQIILQTEFVKKYTQISAINFQKQIRAIISFYQKYSHSILPNFKTILDYIQVLMLENEEDLKMLINRLEGTLSQAKLRKIWNLRS